MMRGVEITTKGIWAIFKGHVDIFEGHLATPKGTSWITSELLLRDYINKEWNRSGVSLSLRGGTGSLRRRRIEASFKIARRGVRGVVDLRKRSEHGVGGNEVGNKRGRYCRI